MATANITVTFGRLGEGTQEGILESGAQTVADFKRLYFNGESVKVKRGGVVLEDDDNLRNNDVLLVAAKVEGGR